jgi:hypothetical protein
MIDFTFIQLPKWVIDFGTIVIPELLAGWIAAIIFSKLTNKTYSNLLLIVPIAFILLALLETLISYNYRQFVQIMILFISFVYFLKKNVRTGYKCKRAFINEGPFAFQKL